MLERELMEAITTQAVVREFAKEITHLTGRDEWIGLEEIGLNLRHAVDVVLKGYYDE